MLLGFESYENWACLVSSPLLPYPSFVYFPRWQRPAPWTTALIQSFIICRPEIDTAHNDKKSDAVLAALRPELEKIGFAVEKDKSQEGKLYRPVFFADNGRPDRQYEIDAYHPHDQIVLEIEAGRATLGNAIYRDIVQMALLVDVQYAAVAVPLTYRYSSTGKQSVNFAYKECRSILDSIYGGRRLDLPFKGLLLVGY